MAWYSYPNRTLCAVLEEMRNAVKHLAPERVRQNKAFLAGCIEEVQCYANRMEAGLEDKADILRAQERKAELKREINATMEELKALVGKVKKAKAKAKKPKKAGKIEHCGDEECDECK